MFSSDFSIFSVIMKFSREKIELFWHAKYVGLIFLMLFSCLFVGSRVPRSRHIRASSEMLEKRNKRDRRHQDPQESSIIRSTRTNRSFHSLAFESRKC